MLDVIVRYAEECTAAQEAMKHNVSPGCVFIEPREEAATLAALRAKFGEPDRKTIPVGARHLASYWWPAFHVMVIDLGARVATGVEAVA